MKLVIFMIILNTITAFSQQKDKPNIIVIMADDMGYECVSSNGSEDYQTPNLDKMTNEGVRFTNFYANPICTPSRCKIMTGLSNIRNYVRFGVLDRDQKTFAHYLKNAGYRTCIAGKWQLGRQKDSAQHFGFEQSLLWQHTRSRTKEVTTFDSRHVNPRLELNGVPKNYENGEFGPDLCINFINDFIKKHKNEPIFAYYPMILPHCPFVTTPDTPDFDPKSKGCPSYKGEAKYFKDMVQHIDKIIGKLENHLEKEGIADNTFILFTCDNGTDSPITTKWNGTIVPGGKGSMTDNGFRVPCIIKFPGKIKKGLVTDAPADLSDILPTICEIAGAKTPGDYDGTSLMTILNDKPSKKDFAYIFFERSKGSLTKGTVMARTRTHQLIRKGREGSFILSECSKPFAAKVIAKKDYTEADKAAFKKLAAIITQRDQLFNSALSEKTKVLKAAGKIRK